MIDKLIETVFTQYYSVLGEDTHQLPISPNTDFTQVPTLLKGYYETMSPMLLERYKMFGTWLNGPHGDWLSLEEMEALCHDWDNEERKNTYAFSLKTTVEVWDNDAIRLFKPERISVFATYPDSYERIYLLWFDGLEEPELWVYTSDGVARFKDLSAYLSYSLDDKSPPQATHWILGYIQ